MKPFTVELPGSKSHTHRALICAALAEGESLLENALISEDTLYTLSALWKLGIKVWEEKGFIRIEGTAGRFRETQGRLFLGNSGTSMRLLTAFCALVPGEHVLTGSPRLNERPVGPLVEALREWGVEIFSNGGSPPVSLKGGKVRGGLTHVDGSLSSQFVSALLLIGPYTEEGGIVRIKGGLVSEPYVDVTCEVMEAFSLKPQRKGDEFHLPRGFYQGRHYLIPGDPSSATYFLLAGAITGKPVKVKGLDPEGKHPDTRFIYLLKEMGAQVELEKDGVIVWGGNLRGIEVDMKDMPDAVPSLAVGAAFARGETIIKNVSHLALKESDRLKTISENLRSMGIEVQIEGNDLRIKGGTPKGALIHPHNDHRIAMAFAIASLKVKDLQIRDKECVKKSFPTFWDLFERLKEALG
jgi:3-phosphoshikimate 1-carboxyvinyltransferase